MTQLENHIGGAWVVADTPESLPVVNPATGEIMTHVPLSPANEVYRAAQAAAAAFPDWRETPAV